MVKDISGRNDARRDNRCKDDFVIHGM
jgi:hypothetical protein